jgi:flagellar assembly protein FliH
MSDWEIVGERAPAANFSPLECPILGDSRGEGNFNFDNFSVVAAAESLSDNVIGQSGGPPPAPPEGLVSEDQHQRELAEQFESGHIAGYEEGYATGKAESEASLNELKSHAAEFLTALNQESLTTFQRMEKHAVQLALSIAKKILSTTAEVRPEYILEVVRDGLKLTGAAKPLRIRVSPADLEFIEVVGMPPELSTEELGAKYVLDESVRSGCVIETDFGDIDLQLEKMWEQVAANLYEVYK